MVITNSMKNVLVVHTHNLSGYYIQDQRLKSPGRPVGDSCDIVQMPTGYQPDESVDGVRFWHFKNKIPQSEPANKNTDADLRFWIEKLRAALPQGEKLDAIVVPAANAREGASLVEWLREVKQQLPETKVYAVDPHLHTALPTEAAKRIAVPLTSDAAISTRIKKAVIRAGDTGYRLADGLDLVTKNLNGAENANELRALLGMKPLPPLAQTRHS